jgi:hypothetical protein
MAGAVWGEQNPNPESARLRVFRRRSKLPIGEHSEAQRTGGTTMADIQLTLTAEEQEYLKGLLDEVLKEKLVEEHRTRTISYRGYVVEEEKVIESLLRKLGAGK